MGITLDQAVTIWKPTSIGLNARVGICITTYGSEAYVELGLACLAKHEPSIPALVHDDASPRWSAVADLAAKYKAAFATTPDRQGSVDNTVPGDVEGAIATIEWAELLGLDIVVKCSRRMILNRPWSQGLVETMVGYQNPTASNIDCAHLLGFRSELFAMHVDTWHKRIQMLRALVNSPPHRHIGWAEGIYHTVAQVCLRDFYGPGVSSPAIIAESGFRKESACGYAPWPMMGLSKRSQQPGILWHQANPASDYYELAREYGLHYSLRDYEVVQH